MMEIVGKLLREYYEMGSHRKPLAVCHVCGDCSALKLVGDQFECANSNKCRHMVMFMIKRDDLSQRRRQEHEYQKYLLETARTS